MTINLNIMSNLYDNRFEDESDKVIYSFESNLCSGLVKKLSMVDIDDEYENNAEIISKIQKNAFIELNKIRMHKLFTKRKNYMEYAFKYFNNLKDYGYNGDIYKYHIRNGGIDWRQLVSGHGKHKKSYEDGFKIISDNLRMSFSSKHTKFLLKILTSNFDDYKYMI